MVFKSKKGVEPLIAAVLLIVVTVGIGAVVVGIIRGYVTENKEVITKTATDVQCSTNVQIIVPTYNDAFRICNSSTNINFTLENTGSLAVDELQVKVFGEDGISVSDGIMTEGLAPGQTKTAIVVNYSGTGALQQVIIVPKKKVAADTNRIYCNEAALKFSSSDISSC